MSIQDRINRYLQLNALTVGGIWNLDGPELLNALADPKQQKFILNQALTHWTAEEGGDIPVKVRKLMGRLAALTIDGQPLRHLHPGPIKVYRGTESGQLEKSKPRSWTPDKKHARIYGSKILTLHITHNQPALDLDKIRGNAGEFKEILVL